MTGLYIAAGIWLLGFLGILGLILFTALALWRDRKTPGETLWLNATAEDDPVRAYTVAHAIRRMHSGAGE